MSQARDAVGRLGPYLEIVSAFVERRMAAVEFQRRYRELYLQDATEWTSDEFAVLETLFGDTDVFEADPQLRPQVTGAIGEGELRGNAARALEALRRLSHHPTT
jgi:hypothetical protein